MLWHKAIGAGGTGGAPNIEYIGSVTKTAFTEGNWDTPGEALNVLSIAQTGDLVVLTFTFDTDKDSGGFTWGGMDFTTIHDSTQSNGGGFVGYHIVSSGDSNPYVLNVDNNVWRNLTIVASVFRGATSHSQSAVRVPSDTESGLILAPALSASGDLWVLTCNLRANDDSRGFITPSGYTLAAQRAATNSKTAIFYQIGSKSSQAQVQVASGNEEAENRTFASTNAFLE